MFGSPTFAIAKMLHSWGGIALKLIIGFLPPIIPAGALGSDRSAPSIAN